MLEQINEALARIETEQGVRILFAAESGSRAWGFASPDSDYDVRFIYVPPREWYLHVFDQCDVIEAMLPNDLDLSGWELRKTLRLFANCNLALNEWLGSPIVYRDDACLAPRLREQIAGFFNPAAAVYHYLSMAKGTYRDHLQAEMAPIKKLFYFLRPILACAWIAQTRTMPPTEFAQLLAAPWVDDILRQWITGLLESKAKAKEAQAHPLDPKWRDWMLRELDYYQETGKKMAEKRSADLTALDRILCKCTAHSL